MALRLSRKARGTLFTGFQMLSFLFFVVFMGHTIFRRLSYVEKLRAQPEFDATFGSTEKRARTAHAGVLLPNGDVLLVGGDQKESEIFIPALMQFRFTRGALSESIGVVSAHVLKDGRIVLMHMSGFEVFDPVSESFNHGYDERILRHHSSTTLLHSGKILLVGGILDRISVSSAVLLDPITLTVEDTGSLSTGNRHLHTATLLPSGEVLIIGGVRTFELSNRHYAEDYALALEIYKPLEGVFVSVGFLNGGGAAHHRSVLLGDRQILVNGGHKLKPRSRICDVETKSCAITSPPLVARRYHTATLLPDGRVLIVGGVQYENRNPTSKFWILNTCELFDPRTGTYTRTANMSEPRRFHAATLLQNGKVLITGGSGNRILSSVEIYDPVTEEFERSDPFKRLESESTET